MSGWAQREAERKEDEANEMDELITENRELTAERDQLAAHVERLVGALECVPVDLIHAIENGDTGANVFLSAGSCKLIDAALAATPAQSLAAHDAAVKVAVLREVAGKLAEMCKKLERTRTHPITWEACEEWILDEADPIEKEAL